jgi:uncharacterized metal-binding protein
MADKCCGEAPKLIFACSGAADVGAIADRAARKLARDGVGRMFCIVGLGGDVGPMVEATRKAGAILAIDGCGTDCVKKTLERHGSKDCLHLRVTDLGLEKGKSPATDGSIGQVASAGAEKLA